MTLAQLRRCNAERLALRLQMEQATVRLVRLGPRPTLELLTQIGIEHGILPDVAKRLEAYGELSPELVRAVGADRIEPRRPMLVASR